MNLFLGIIISYIIGSIPTSYIFGKLIKKIDLREYGSGNLGATNVFRTLGAKWGIVTLLLDILKGFVCVFFISKFLSSNLVSVEACKVIFGISSIFGHVYTIFLKFKGGKGVATSTGVFLALDWKVTFIAFLAFFIVVYFTRYISLGSILSAIVLPISMCFLSDVKLYLILSMVVSAFVVVKHKPNIRRLVLGVENKISFGESKK